LLTEWAQGYPVRAVVGDGVRQMIQARVFTQTTEFAYTGLGTRVAVSVAGYGTTLYALDYAAGNRILAKQNVGQTVSLPLSQANSLRYIRAFVRYILAPQQGSGEIVTEANCQFASVAS
jgi:hypothetical protein